MATQVFLHVGLPKTGTSYLQAILWANREALKADGLLLPGTRRSQLHAAIDALGHVERAHYPPRVRGSWSALVEEIHAWPDQVLVSRENLCAANASRIGQMAGDLAPAEVHVILTVRDLARAIPAFWQQGVKIGRRDSLESYVQSIRDGTDATRRFRWAQYPELVASRWAEHVPPEQIHLVTVPPPGSPPETLWRRFSGLLGIEVLPLVESAPVNPSLGVVETELLRRTNASLTPRLRERQRAYWTKVILANNILGRHPGEPFALPEHAHHWVVQRAEKSVLELRAGGYDVHGDLDDLLPGAGRRRRTPDEVGDAELLTTATETIAELVVQLRDAKFAERRARARARRHGRTRARARRRGGAGLARPAPPGPWRRVAGRLRRKGR